MGLTIQRQIVSPKKLYSNLLLIKIMNGLYIAINQIGRFYFIIIIIIIIIICR